MKFFKTILVLIGISLLCSCATPEKKSSTINNLTKKKAHPASEIPPEEKSKVRIIEKKVIAVMKFENLSKNPKFDWLCEGIASTLVSKLGNVKKVRLVERSQVVKSLQEINFNMSGVVDEKTAVSAGKILGAEIMVIGEFQKSADQMRITARFVDVATGKIINTAEATGSYNDMFSLQDEIAFNLLKTLGIKVKLEEQKKMQEKPTESLTAYEWVEKAENILEEKGKGISKEDLNLVIKYCKNALEIDPALANAYYNLGLGYDRKGLWDKAIGEYKKAIKIKPDFANAHYDLGLVYNKKGLYDQAKKEFKEIIRMNPDYVVAYYGLGVIYYKQRLFGRAIEEFKNTIRINPDYVDAHYCLGVSYVILGRRVDALDEYNILKNLDKERADKLFNWIYK